MSYMDRIGDRQQIPDAIATTATKQAQQVSEARSEAQNNGAASASVKADHADLSTAGGLISRALEGSDVRPEKVAALQQAIASGSYHVSSSDIADKLIDTLMD